MALSLALLASPSQAADGDQNRDCLEELISGQGLRIACSFPVAMTEDELAQVRKITHEVLQDAKCLMRIDIERRMLNEAMADVRDHEFAVPPQPVECEVKTKSNVLPIKFSFAPKVTFKGGVAVAATPGMDNVTGVSRILSWPVQTWVNNSGSIRKNMLLVVNAYLKRFPAGKG